MKHTSVTVSIKKRWPWLAAAVVALLALTFVFATTGASFAAPPAAPSDGEGASTIGDFVWRDLNSDGQQDAGEPGINGVRVDLYLDDGDGIFEPGAGDVFLKFTTTGDDPSTPQVETGWYEFTEIEFGGPTYWVHLPVSNFSPGQPLNGSVLTSSSTYGPNPTLVIEPSIVADRDDIDFGYARVQINLQKTIYLGHNNGANCPGGLETVQATVGAQVTYCFVVTNTGDTFLNSITISDPQLGITQAQMTLKSGSLPLAPNATRVYYYQTTASVDLTNIATTTGVPTDASGTPIPGAQNPSDDDQATVDVVQANIQIDKTVYVGHNLGASCPGSELVSGAAGTQITYCFRVTNTGNTHLDQIQINDATLGITQANMTLVGSPTLPLAPGASLTYFYQTTLTRDLMNTATATGNPTDPNGNDIPGIDPPTDTDTAETNLVAPAIRIDKTVYLGHNSGASCPSGAETVTGATGAQVTYCFVVTNTGDTHLSSISVTDISLGIPPALLTLKSGTQPLAPGATLVYYYQTTITGDLTNTAVASGNPTDANGNDIPGLNNPSDDDTANVNQVAPAIDIQKTVYLGHNSGASCAGVESVTGVTGAQVTYCFRVQNTGDTHLTNIQITDNNLGITQANMTLRSGSIPLAPNGVLVYYYQTTITTDLINTATVTGTPSDPNGTPLPGVPPPTDNDTAQVDRVAPAIQIQKTVYLGHNSGASCPGGELVGAPNGSLVTYCFVVTNTGDTHLNSITIVDNNLGITRANMTLLSGSEPLAPNASMTFYYQTTINGNLVNTATASGTPSNPAGTPLPGVPNPIDDDTAQVTGTGPGIRIDKTVYRGWNSGASCPGAELVATPPGSQITYCFAVVNTGQTWLTNIVLTDQLLGIDRTDLITKSGTIPLAPGASLVYYYQATSSGTLTNTADVTATVSITDGTPIPGQPPVTDDDTARVQDASPAIQLQKTVYLGHNTGNSCPGAENVQGQNGAAITYCFVVINTGNTYLNSIAITDTALGIPPAALTLKSGSQPLAPGASLVFYYQTTLTADLVNTAVVRGTPTDSGGVVIPGLPRPTDDDTASVDLIAPGIQIQKTVYLGHNSGNSCPGVETVTGTSGSQITYCFVVTNTGDTYLTNIAISDPSLGITQANMTLKSGVVPLAPGQSLVYFYQTTISRDLQNLAIATGTPSSPSGTPIPGAENPSDDDTANVDRIAPGLRIEKTVYAGHNNGASCPGGESLTGVSGSNITYCFQVINTGDTYLNSISISDAPLGITRADMTLLSGVEPLAPGASLVFYYQTTLQNDLQNTAVTTGTPSTPGGTTIPGTPPSDDDTSTVTVVSPGVVVNKTVYAGHNNGASCPAGEQVTGKQGDPITFCFVVTNTGDTHLVNITLTDPLLGITQVDMTLKSGVTPLAPGASLVYYYPTTISGDLVNVVTVNGTPSTPGGAPIPNVPPPTDTDDSSVVEIKVGSIGDRVWYDINANGVQDPNEPGLAGVTVTLYDPNGNMVLQTTTNGLGNYLFSDVPAGQYTVGFTLPGDGYFISPKDQGADNTLNSKANIATGRTDPFTLNAGQDITNIDAGIYTPPILTVTKTDFGKIVKLPNEDLVIYQITVENIGLGDATGTMLTETVPTYTVYVQADSTPGWSCADNSPAGTKCIFKVNVNGTEGLLRPGEKQTVKFAVRVLPDTPGQTILKNVVIAEEDGTQGRPPGYTPPTAEDTTPVEIPKLVVFGLPPQAVPQDGAILIEWTTVREINTAGFDILRSTDGQLETAVKITPEMIEARGGSDDTYYSFLDETALEGITYTYWVKETETTGIEIIYAPFTGSVQAAATRFIFLPVVTK